MMILLGLNEEQYHSDDLRVTGTSSPIPIQLNREGIPFGGSESTALNAINYVTVDYAAVANRVIGYIRENIDRRKAREAVV